MGLRTTRSGELGGALSDATVGAGRKRGGDGGAHGLVLRELGQVLVGEVGGSMEFGSRDQVEDLGPLPLASSLHSTVVLVV
jgi:hypothetical protein